MKKLHMLHVLLTVYFIRRCLKMSVIVAEA